MKQTFHLLRSLFISTIALSFFTILESKANAADSQQNGRLYFGWAVESITPDKPVALAGQYHTRITSKVADPLTATALAIETRNANGGIDQAVMVSVDLVVIRGKTQDQVRELVKNQVPDLDVKKVLISATHTHTAPALTYTNETDLHPYEFARSWAYRIPEDRKDVMPPEAYLSFIAERISSAVVKAWKARKPGGLSIQLSHAVVAQNRRAVYAGGTARMYGSLDDPGFTHIEGVSDHSVDLLFFWREGKQLDGIAINIYCPPQEVERREELSADFWYNIREQLRERFHADLFILPLCGAAGDQSPHLMWDKKAEAAMRSRRVLGNRQEIARRVLRAVDDVYEIAESSIATSLPFEHRVKRARLPVWPVSEERYQESVKLYEAGKNRVAELAGKDYIYWRVSETMMARYALQKTDPFYQIEVHCLRLGDLAVATNPFELFTDYGVRIKGRSPANQTAIVQLTAGCGGYLATKRAVSGGGYSARIDDGVVGPEGGKVLVDETIKILKEMWPR